MSLITPDGKITQLSVSQVEKADSKQTGGCMRRWWFETPQGLKPEQSYTQNEGTAGHELLRRYLLTGENPKGRTLMGKAVTGAILKGELPAPGDDLIVEKRFSGQDMRDDSRCECGHRPDEHGAKGCKHFDIPDGAPGPQQADQCDCSFFRSAWVPLNVAETLHLAGVPWDGAIDLVYRRGDRPVVMDHKFSSDPETYAKRPSELIKTVQMPVYAHSQRPYWPDAREFELVHHYVSKKGVLSFMRRAVVTVEQVEERIADVVAVVERMKAIAPAKNQDDVPASPGPACEAWSGCPHQSICSAFKRRNTHPRGATPMALSPEEEAVFREIPVDAAHAAAPAPAPAQAEDDELPPLEEEAPAEDAGEVAKLQAQLAAAQKALADKQAAAAAKKPARRMLMHDTDAEGNPVAAPVPQASAPAVEAPTVCPPPCGVTITPENGSKLQDGKWTHVVDCAHKKPAAPPPPPPRARASSKKASDAPPVPGTEPKTPPPAPPVFKGERQSDRDATAALDAMKASKGEGVAAVPPGAPPLKNITASGAAGPAPAPTAPVQVPEVKAPTPTAAPVSLYDAACDFLRARFEGKSLPIGVSGDELIALINAATAIVAG